MDVFVSSSRDETLLLFLIRVLGLESQCKIVTEKIAQPRLKTAKIELRGLSTVCRYLSLQNSIYEPAQLLGNTPEQSAQISEWISLLLSGTSYGDGSYQRINAHLESRVFLVGQGLTLADLMCYALIHPVTSMLPVAQYGHFCNLIRWHQFIQKTVDTTSIFTPAKRTLPVFDFSPPPKKQFDEKKTNEKALSGAQTKVEKDEQPVTLAQMNGETTAVKEKSSDETKTKRTKEAKERKPKEAKKKEEPRIDMVDMRVGQILTVKPHPDADSLYIEEINVGEEKPRQVISGLVKFVPIDQMQNRIVVVCCNLKPANMRGVQSNGMVMCASNADHTEVEPLIVPTDVPVGEKIVFEGYDRKPLEEIKPKQKILEALFPDLMTDGEGIAKYKQVSFMTSKGPLKSRIINGSVS